VGGRNLPFPIDLAIGLYNSLYYRRSRDSSFSSSPHIDDGLDWVTSMDCVELDAKILGWVELGFTESGSYPTLTSRSELAVTYIRGSSSN